MFRRREKPKPKPGIEFVTYDVIPTDPGSKFLVQLPSGYTADQYAAFVTRFKEQYPDADGLIIIGAKVTVL